MEQLAFNYNSPRAKQARLGSAIGPPAMYWTSVICAVLLVVFGAILLLLQDMALGWLVVSLAAPFYMITGWGKYLQALAPATGNSIDAVLEADLLAKLHASHTPQDVARLLVKTKGHTFFAVRFLLGTDFLEQVVSNSAADSHMMWQEAERLRQVYSLPLIDSAVLTAALIKTAPSIEEYLAHVSLDKDDIDIGLRWFAHVQELVASHAEHKTKGGIGRDWAFGYTPLLSAFGNNITEYVTYSGLLSRELASREQALAQTMHVLAQAGRRNVTLVGGLGSGKTKLVYSLAQKLIDADKSVPKELHFRQVIALDPSVLISRARGRGELEELVQRLCYEALRAKNIILFLDDAQLFFEEGTGSVNLSNVLLPILDGGALQLILAMDEQRWLQISQANPALSQYMNRVVMPVTDETETIEVMQNQLVMYEYQHKVTYTYQSLVAAYRLSNRYIAEQVMPGRAVTLLESAANFAEDKLVTAKSVEDAIEQTQGIKVGTAQNADERATLLNLEDLIHQRMINQVRAVQVVSDALRRARAGVRNQNRPIGTFLFLGPTGVGKTELAKSVAAVFFGGEENLARLDLNEYSRPEDVGRLIADAAQDSHSLTAQISRKPFSVVLLDEIEKAHPEVLNTLLQMLDEGILRDTHNREVSFRDAVIIATSNAGADKLRAHIEAGQTLEDFESQFTDELVSSNTFRPEFMNRFDEIVLFRPLEPSELLQVVDLILASINKNLASQKVSVLVEDDAKKLLVEAGNDPRLGARPMRRIVQRVVENIVAQQLLHQQIQPGEQIVINRQAVEQMLARK